MKRAKHAYSAPQKPPLSDTDQARLSTGNREGSPDLVVDTWSVTCEIKNPTAFTKSSFHDADRKGRLQPHLGHRCRARLEDRTVEVIRMSFGWTYQVSSPLPVEDACANLAQAWGETVDRYEIRVQSVTVVVEPDPFEGYDLAVDFYGPPDQVPVLALQLPRVFQRVSQPVWA